MEDYNRVLEATSVAENANGVAAEKMTVYNESLEAAQNRLTASIQQFAQDSNLDRILALAYDGLSKVVEILNILLNKIPVLSPLIKALGIALTAAFGAKMIQNITNLGKGISGLASIVGSVGTAASSVGSILTTTAVTIGSFAVPVWGVVAAVAAIAGAIGLVVQASKDNTPEAKLERLNQELEDGQGNLKDTQSQISEIDKKIKEIDDKGALTLADEQEKTRLEEQRDVLEQILQYQKDINEEKLKEIKEEVSAQMGGKYTSGTIDSDTAYESKKGTRSGVGSSYAASSGTATKYYNAENASISELLANIRLLNEEQQRLTSTEGNHSQELSENNKLIQENINQLKQRATSIGEDISKMQELGLTDTQAYKDAVSQWNQLQSYLDPSNFEKISLESLIDTSGLEQKVQKAAQDTSDIGKEAARGYAEKFAQQILSDNSMKQAWATSMGVTAEYLENNTDVLIQEILSKFQQMYVDIGESAQKGYGSASQVFSDYLSEVDALSEKQTLLNKALGEMQYNGELTSDTVRELTKEYPQLSSKIEIQNGKLVLEKKYLEEVWTAAVEASRGKQSAQIEDTKKTLEQVNARIELYKQEASVLIALGGAGDKSAGRVGYLKQIMDTNDKNSQEYINAAREYGHYMTEQNKESLRLRMALEEASKIQGSLGDIPGLEGTKPKGYKSGSSGADKAAKEFEDSIKDKVKNLKSIVDLYSEQQDWDDPSVIQKYTDDYNNLLNEVINNPKARQVLADSFNLDISKMSDEEAIENLTTLWKKQAGTIDEAYQKLSKNALNEMDKLSKAREQEYEDAVKNIESLQKMTVNMIETAIDLFQKAGDIVFSLIGKLSKKYDKQIDALDAQMDNLDKIADNLDDQKDAFDDKIDAQKEMLKLQKEEMDNADELADKNKSIADIDAQLMELQYDNSAEAQAKRLKLLDERAQKEKDLSDYQKDQAYDTKVNALDREKDAYDKNIEAQKKYIEAQKEALKEQQDAIKAAQDKFEQNLSKAQSVFNGFVKVISSDIFKNLAANLLDSLDGKTLEKVLTAWNKWFGDGLESTAKNTIEKGFGSLKSFGWKRGDWVPDFLNIGKQGQQTEKDVQSVISDALAKNESGPIDFNSYKKQIDSLTSAFDGFKKNALSSVEQVSTNTANSVKSILQLGEKSLDKMASSGNGLVQTIGKGIKNAIGISKNGVSSIYNSVTQMLQATSQNGVSSITMLGANGQGVLSSLGQMAYNLLGNLGNYASQILNMFTQGSGGIFSTLGNLALKAINGVGGVASKAFSAVVGMGSKAVSAVVGIGSKAVSAIGSAAGAITGGAGLAGGLATGGLIGAGVAAAGYGIYSSVKNIKNAWSDPNRSTLSKVGSTLWNISPVGIVWNAGKGIVKGIASGVKKIGKWFKGLFHHSGSDYVKKEHPELDRMLGLKDDETVSILKVGEAVVPTWANSASSSASGSRYTGSPVSGIVSSAVKSARASMGASNVSNSTNSSINISMPINIKGDADDSTVRALKDATNNIVNTVLKTINGQTRMGGYRNIKAATV